MDSADVLIRPAVVDDADGIASVKVLSWQQGYKGIVPDHELDAMSASKHVVRWREILNRSDSVTWIAVSREEVLAFASIGPCRDADMPPGSAELWALYVSPDHWRCGIGARLWSEMKITVIPPAAPIVSVLVLADNERARRFYEKQGFQADGTSRVIVIGGRNLDEVRYVQKLH